MSLALKKPPYPYIATNKTIAHGAPIIKGTRITVRTIAGYYQLGMSADEILTALPHLTPAQVHSALAYYFDHQEEIDRDIEDAANIDYWKNQALPHPGLKKTVK
jgi:uncharacterized protein (DUF433 family)